jgi:hypothetical protein
VCTLHMYVADLDGQVYLDCALSSVSVLAGSRHRHVVRFWMNRPRPHHVIDHTLHMPSYLGEIIYYRAVVEVMRDLWREILKEFTCASLFSSPVSVSHHWPRDARFAAVISRARKQRVSKQVNNDISHATAFGRV